MQVAQRGTSFADLNGYGLDRFGVGSSDDGAITVTQDTTVPSGEGFKNSMKFDVTTADTSLGAAQFYQFFQKIEGQNVAHLMYGTSNAKTITLSFWCRSNKTGTYVTTFMNNAADRFNPNNFTISSANTWEKKTITVTGDQSGTWLTTNGIGMYVIWNLALGSDFDDGTNGTWGASDYGSGGNVNFLDSTDNEFYITGVQMEVGDTVTPFEHRSFSDELQRCMRYYEKSYPYSVAPGTAISYPGNLGITVRGMDEETSGQRYITNTMRVEKRADPANTFYDDAGNAGKVTTFNNAGTGTNNVGIALVVTQPSMIGCGPNNSAIWGFGFFYESDAEL